MRATLKRRVDVAHFPVHALWWNAWLDWGKAVRQRWSRLDPKAMDRHEELFEPLYQEWGEALTAGELSTFLSRGALLTKWWPSAPTLWNWLWEGQRGWIEENLRAWPNQLPQPPAVPDGALERVMEGATTAEDVALAMALCAAQLRRER